MIYLLKFKNFKNLFQLVNYKIATKKILNYKTNNLMTLKISLYLCDKLLNITDNAARTSKVPSKDIS